MLSENLLPCGVLKDRYGDIQIIFGKLEGNNKKTLIVNNEPFGLICAYGFSDLDLDEYVKYAQSATNWQENKVFEYMVSMLTNPDLRGEFSAVIKIDNGFLCITDTDTFEGVTMPVSDWQNAVKPYKTYVDVSDGDDYYDELGEANATWLGM